MILIPRGRPARGQDHIRLLRPPVKRVAQCRAIIGHPAKIDQIIYVSRDGHKGIVLGHKGETMKAISKAAREELEEFLGRRVHLFTQVKVRPNWLDEAERYSEMGLEFKDGN